MKIQVIITLLVSVIMLGACSTVAVPVAEETPIPIKLTATPLPTSTAFPTQTASPTPEQFDFSMLSPDGTKKIQSRDWVTFDILDVKSGKVLRSFSYDRAKFGEGAGYLPEAGYVPFYWSQNGEYIYVYAHQGWDGGIKYFGDVFGAEEGVARFNVNTGMMEEIVPEREGGGYTFSISPDEKGIVYIDQRETPLVLRLKNLSNNNEQVLFTFDETINDIGSYGWSPEMDKIVFMGLEVQNPGYTDGSQKFIYSMYVMNLTDPRPYRIVQGLDEWLEFNTWTTENLISYKDWDDTIWQLDLESKTFVAVGTATPPPLKLPNKACTRLVGGCAFSSILRGLEWIPAKWRCLVPPTSG